ncbi:DUF1266 domain-containing protein [Streptomyces albulus]|nr:DUF1266 domain-containing protein [Streptomyces noursei]
MPRRGPLHGPVARGLACGAPLAVHHSVPWNELGTAFLDYSTDAETLRAQWSVGDPVSWQQRFEQLLGGQFVPAETETALRARSRAGAGAEPAGTRRPTAAPRPRSRSWSAGTRSGSGRTGCCRPTVGWCHWSRWTWRAVGLVRWGLGARWCAPPQAEQAVVRVATRAAEVYGSWEEFAAGYTLGRVLAFDNGWFGPAYGETAHLHRVLTQDPASPWRTLPFA